MPIDNQTGNPAASRPAPGSISPLEAASLIKENASGNDLLILDVRTPEEFSGGHLEKAINIDLFSPNFKSKLDELARDKTYLVYCHSGSRGASALGAMTGMGFDKMYNISDGIAAWQEAGLPLVR